MAKSTIYLREKLAESILNGTAFSVTDLYVGLFKQMPTLQDASDGVEHTLGNPNSGYARVRATGLWTQDTGRLPLVRYKLNTLLAFESLQNGWNNDYTRADVLGVGLFDDETAGNCLAFVDLNPVRSIHPNQDMDIDLDGLIIDFSVI